MYYNPGTLVLIKEPELLLSGTVFQLEKVHIRNALGPGRSVSDTRWFMAPTLFARELEVSYRSLTL